MGRVEAGQLIGYDEVNHRTQYAYSLVAVAETMYLTLTADTILSIAREHPAISLQLQSALAHCLSDNR